jgi:hypothetical protein
MRIGEDTAVWLGAVFAGCMAIAFRQLVALLWVCGQLASDLRARELIITPLADPSSCRAPSYLNPHNMESDLFPHRGFMLDTGRKSFPVQAIHYLLTVLQQYNFNVFHWHVYDAESFPMHWPADCGLTNVSIEHSNTSKYYTPMDIQSVISHAQRLGILVYPETDMPGHSDIW